MVSTVKIHMVYSFIMPYLCILIFHNLLGESELSDCDTGLNNTLYWGRHCVIKNGLNFVVRNLHKRNTSAIPVHLSGA